MKEKGIELSVDTNPTRGKWANKDRTPNSIGNQAKNPTMSDRIMAAATGILYIAAPRDNTD